MLSPKRDTMAAKHFLQMALWRSGQMRPRVINVDGHAAYPAAFAELQQTGELGQRCQCRPRPYLKPYLNNVLEQDHRFVKKRLAASLRFRSVGVALRTIEGYDDEHDLQRAGPMAGEGRHSRPGAIHRAGVRDRGIA
jgi:transposase-like protein